MIDYGRIIEEKLCRFAKLGDPSLLDEETGKAVRKYVNSITIAGIQQHTLRDRRPDLLEQQLEAARATLRDAIKQIEAIDGWALSIARRGVAKAEMAAAAALDDPEALMAAIARHAVVPVEQWPDKVAVANLRVLEQGLRLPTEIAIEKAAEMPQGKGAKPDLVARRVALEAGRALLDLTGEVPTYREDGTAFAKLTAELFREFGIKAHPLQPCKYALAKLPTELPKKP